MKENVLTCNSRLLQSFIFIFSAFTVKLASGQSFDFETKPKAFVITCTADDGFLQATSSVTVSILDTNEAPYFQQAAVDIRVNEGPVSCSNIYLYLLKVRQARRHTQT